MFSQHSLTDNALLIKGDTVDEGLHSSQELLLFRDALSTAGKSMTPGKYYIPLHTK